MLNTAELRKVLDLLLLQSGCVECDHPTQPAALPDATLESLVAITRQRGVMSVFEFGSGRSTAAMLREGLRVTSLEDSHDTRIPTLSRFCGRLAAANPALLHRRMKVGHTFDIFARAGDKAPLVRSHSLLEILKGWRRFFVAWKQ
jgi:hypothetical protein